MKEQHVLVDYENVQPTLEQLAKLAPGFSDVWLFHGPHQVKQAQQLAAAHEKVTLVPRSGKGPNALDFHLSFYLGYVAARHSEATLVVVANDTGYDPMIVHAKALGFAVRRVGFKAKMPAAVKQVAPAAKPVVAHKPAPGKKAAPAKAATPAKKPTAKAPIKSALAKQAPAKKMVATKKKVPAKKAPFPAKAPAQASVKGVVKASATAPAKKALVKKVPAKKITAPKAAVQAAPAAASHAKEIERIKKSLDKMGDKRPHKLKSFLRHLESMLGKISTPATVEALVKKLEQENVVHIVGDLVLYS